MYHRIMVNLVDQEMVEENVKEGLNLLGLKIHDIIKSNHPLRRAKSFKYAFEGVLHALLNEPNFRIQIVIVITATILGFYFKIDTTQWGLLILSMGLLLFAELVNTVVEEFMDYLIPERNGGAKIIKDLSAGFVLIMSFTCLAILVLIFGEHFLPLIGF